MRIFLHFHDGYAMSTHVSVIRDALDATPLADLVVTPEQADVVLFLPTFASKFHWYARALDADEIIREHLEKVLVFESCDGPTDFLRGVYCNLTPAQMDPARHRAIGFTNAKHVFEPDADDPKLLYSFRGALSHPVRTGLCEILAGDAAGRVTAMDRWLNYSEDEQRDYWRELRDSAFVLCPRGLGTTSRRLQETMEAGRAPVILADDWIAPTGPDWEAFAIRCAESDVAALPDLLRERRGDAAEMGCLARSEWERFCAPGEPFGTWLVKLLRELVENRPADWTPEAERARWATASFRWDAGYDPLHRMINKARRALKRG